MIVPLVVRDHLLGAMTFASTRPEHRYRSEDLRLAEEVARRASLALDNAQLYAVAQEAIRARELVLGVVAHDLRNPLGTIGLQASLIRREAPKVAQVIERAVARMNRLIGDLLDLTRIATGSLAVERAPLSTRQVLAESVATQKALAASASLELRLDLEEEVPDAWADHDRLLQILENLIGNAVKFSEPNGSITVGAGARDGEVLFWVRDTGTGIAAKDLPHVFERYWQAKETRRRGTGLGLPIVKGIVEAHGGRIWVESTRGEGSTFFFAIPTVRGERGGPSPGTEPSQQIGGKKLA
jgi:signal transduction histidine kinase